MSISWRYRVPPHEVETWPEASLKRTLGWAQYVSEEVEKARDG